MCFLAALTVISPLAHAAGKKDIAFLRKISAQFQEDRVFYRWQDSESAEALFVAGSAENGSVFDHYRTNRGHDAGVGLYVAETPASSYDYAEPDSDNQGTRGALVEVRVRKGTPYLDLTDSKVLGQLERGGLSPSDLYAIDHGLALKFDKSDFWVFKSPSGVSFRRFTGADLSTERLQRLNDQIKGSVSRSTFQKLIFGTLIARIRQDPGDAMKHEIAVDAFARWPEASSVVEAAVQGLPEHPKAVTWMARLFLRAPQFYEGLAAEERQVFRAAVAREPSGEAAQSALAVFRNGKLTGDLTDLVARMLTAKVVSSANQSAVLQQLSKPGAVEMLEPSPDQKIAILEALDGMIKRVQALQRLGGGAQHVASERAIQSLRARVQAIARKPHDACAVEALRAIKARQ